MELIEQLRRHYRHPFPGGAGKWVRGAAPGVVLVVVVMGLAASWLVGDDGAGDTPAGNYVPLARVESGPFAVSLSEGVVLDAARSVTIASDLPSNRAKLLYLATEGALLDAGEVIARIDPAPFAEDIAKLESDIQEAEAVLMQARAELELLRVDNEDKLNKLRQQVAAARLKVGNLEGADLAAREALADKALRDARAAEQGARQRLAAERELHARGLSTRGELDRARDNAEQKRLELSVAERNLETLRDTALPAELAQARMGLEHSTREFDNHRDVVLTQKLAKQQAEVVRHESKLATLRRGLEQARGYLARTTLVAPVSGQLLYLDIPVGNEKRKVQVGDSLWQRQGFAVIPDLSALVALGAIRERDIGKVRSGQVVTLHPEAYPGLTLRGRVESIGTLARAGGDAGDNRFAVRIALDDSHPDLRPGMSARADILTRRYREVTRVPVEALFSESGETRCYLWDGGAPRAVAVTTGAGDGEFVAIEAGLEAGQQVMLVHPDSLDR